MLSSCSQDEYIRSAGNDDISFAASMPGISSRTTYDVSDQLFNAGFTVSAIYPDSIVASGSIIPPHFEDKIVSRCVDGLFRSSECRWPVICKENDGYQDNDGYLRFFAFHPSREEMKKLARVGEECFIYSNNTIKGASGVSYDYRLTKFRVAPDIANQVDFVTAIGEGNKTDDLYHDIPLVFEHQLCGVEISVWGATDLYDVEVAGVRVGGSVVEADISLSATHGNSRDGGNTLGEWLITSSSPRGHVDFVFAPGDHVVCINANEHNTKERASSIMGSGGKAMLIPQKQPMWDHVNDKGNLSKGMYFSALIRMYERGGDHHFIFPSTDPDTKASLVYLLVRKSDGEVIRRLTQSEYETYQAPDDLEKRAYGWAAVPVNVDWKAGYTYSYVLDYTKGVGVHDPDDPRNEAGPVVDWDGVEVTVTTGEWGDGEIIKNGGWGANTNSTAPDGTIWWK